MIKTLNSSLTSDATSHSTPTEVGNLWPLVVTWPMSCIQVLWWLLGKFQMLKKAIWLGYNSVSELWIKSFLFLPQQSLFVSVAVQHCSGKMSWLYNYFIISSPGLPAPALTWLNVFCFCLLISDSFSFLFLNESCPQMKQSRWPFIAI